MKPAYYSENDPYAAQFLRNLMAKGLIPKGVVDERSIADVQPDDLIGFGQCHFFAGIAGWALAARLAGWPDDRELWTGSAPCQPFSVAGKGKAQDDDRHLWPHFLRLIRARRPAVVVGEQVAAAVGKDWLDGVFTDLEGIGYACGAAVVPACAVDAPHRRDRLWFMAHAGSQRWFGREGIQGCGREATEWRKAINNAGYCGASLKDVADADADGVPGGQGCALNAGCDQGSGTQSWARPGGSGCGGGDVANVNLDGCEPGNASAAASGYRGAVESGSGVIGWDSAGWVIGHDGKARRVEPGIRLLAHGVSGRLAVVRPGFEGNPEDPEALHWYSRIGALKAFGNAIVPEVGAEVIGAYLDCYPDPYSIEVNA